MIAALASFSQPSRMRVELIGFSSYDFNYLNNNTFSSTVDNFQVYTSLGGVYSKQRTVLSSFTRPVEHYFEYGCFFSYEKTKKITFKTGVLTSYVGGTVVIFGDKTVHRLNHGPQPGDSLSGNAIGGMGSGVWYRTFRFPLFVSYNLVSIKKSKIVFAPFGGITFDYVRNDLDETQTQVSISVYDTMIVTRTSSRVNELGISLAGGFQIKYKFKNGNSMNATVMGCIGFTPLVENDYRYEINGQQFHTELLSNGGYFRIGLGYEFGILKSRFGFNTGSKVSDKNYEFN